MCGYGPCMVDEGELLGLDAVALSVGIRAGEFTASEVLAATMQRIERLDAGLNAVIARCFERAADRLGAVSASAPFAGVPTLVKDLVDVEGLVRSEGSRLQAGNVSPASPAYIEQMEASGLVIAGKTNTPEFASLAVTDNELFGRTLNPWNRAFSPGGSSGGAAVAVAAGYVPIAHGTDGGGSNRIPASACGVFGMKPSRGRMASGELDGSHPVFKTHQTISRSVRDSAVLFAATEDPSGPFDPVGLVDRPLSEPVRIAVSRADIRGVAPEPEAAAALDDAIALLSEMGHHLVEVPAPVDGERLFEAYRSIFLSRTVGMVEAIERQAGRPIEETGLLTRNTIGLMRSGDDLGPGAFEAGERQRLEIGRTMEEFFHRADVWLSLVHPYDTISPADLSPQDEFDAARSERLLSNAPVANMIGAPSMSVPFRFDTPSGVPIGVMCTAAPGHDRLLYELALAVEEASPWAHRWAPGSAISDVRLD